MSSLARRRRETLEVDGAVPADRETTPRQRGHGRSCRVGVHQSPAVQGCDRRRRPRVVQRSDHRPARHRRDRRRSDEPKPAPATHGPSRHSPLARDLRRRRQVHPRRHGRPSRRRGDLLPANAWHRRTRRTNDAHRRVRQRDHRRHPPGVAAFVRPDRHCRELSWPERRRRRRERRPRRAVSRCDRRARQPSPESSGHRDTTPCPPKGSIHSAATRSPSTSASTATSSPTSASRRTGCAISTASASLMTEALIGKTRSEALDLFEDVRAMLTNDDEERPPKLTGSASSARCRGSARTPCASSARRCPGTRFVRHSTPMRARRLYDRDARDDRAIERAGRARARLPGNHCPRWPPDRASRRATSCRSCRPWGRASPYGPSSARSCASTATTRTRSGWTSPEPNSSSSPRRSPFSMSDVVDALQNVYDPEIPVSVVELGLIYRCDEELLADGSRLISIDMSMTAPGCGMGDVLRAGRGDGSCAWSPASTTSRSRWCGIRPGTQPHVRSGPPPARPALKGTCRCNSSSRPRISDSRGIGPHRELKRALEGYWAGRIPVAELEDTASSLRRQRWSRQRALGLDHIPSNDFSLYDHVLDTAVMVGAVPDRYRAESGEVDLDAYFAMARGGDLRGKAVAPLEMTKWFDTNYHYIVPELSAGQGFEYTGAKAVAEFREAKAIGVTTRPVLLGPISFLTLAKQRGRKTSVTGCSRRWSACTKRFSPTSPPSVHNGCRSTSPHCVSISTARSSTAFSRDLRASRAQRPRRPHPGGHVLFRPSSQSPNRPVAARRRAPPRHRPRTGPARCGPRRRTRLAGTVARRRRRPQRLASRPRLGTRGSRTRA